METKYKTDSGEITLSPQIVRDYFASGGFAVTDTDVIMFINLCKYQQLNPFLKEAYLIKVRQEPAMIIIGKEVFTKRASKIQNCRGWQAGITILKSDGSIERREGSLKLKNELLIGGWCKVYRSGWDVPMLSEVGLDEYGKQIASWKSMPGVMIRKVAIVTALRDTFPEDFQGLYDACEMPVDPEKLDDKIPVNNKKLDDKIVKVYEHKPENSKNELTEIINREVEESDFDFGTEQSSESASESESIEDFKIAIKNCRTISDLTILYNLNFVGKPWEEGDIFESQEQKNQIRELFTEAKKTIK